ncbi:MAG: serine hydrolase domain-containing protein, partial [Tumebacillaceae bacterium]
MNTNSIIQHVHRIQQQISSPAAAVCIIHRDQVLTEWYNGVEAHQRFNVYSTRKAYIALTVAMGVHKGKIASIDDPVTRYLPEYDAALLAGTTIRHLLTHTHGLATEEDGRIVRHFAAGTDWQYVNTGIEMLAVLVQRTMGQSVAELLQERVFTPFDFTETAWETEPSPHLLPDLHDPQQPPLLRLYVSPDGDERNLFVSARELARWGHLHLKKGAGRLPSELFEMTTTRQTPFLPKENVPVNGFCWQVQDITNPRMEIGEHVPRGAYQILGKSGCTVLVIPSLDVVAVRMYNKIGNPPGYDYLQDIRTFGNLVAAAAGDDLPPIHI